MSSRCDKSRFRRGALSLIVVRADMSEGTDRHLLEGLTGEQGAKAGVFRFAGTLRSTSRYLPSNRELTLCFTQSLSSSWCSP